LNADEEYAELNAATLHLHVSHADALGLARGMPCDTHKCIHASASVCLRAHTSA
jgi:hypothetical protein